MGGGLGSQSWSLRDMARRDPTPTSPSPLPLQPAGYLAARATPLREGTRLLGSLCYQVAAGVGAGQGGAPPRTG